MGRGKTSIYEQRSSIRQLENPFDLHKTSNPWLQVAALENFININVSPPRTLVQSALMISSSLFSTMNFATVKMNVLQDQSGWKRILCSLKKSTKLE